MAGSRRMVLEFLAAVADGHPVDEVWTEALLTQSDRSRALRTIAELASVHRTLHRTADERTGPAPSEPVGAPPLPTDPIGRPRWGPFQLLERLGSGSSAEVFRAYDPQLGREVALKLYKRSFGRGPGGQARMLREARAMARVQHEHIVQVYGADEHDGTFGIWMHLVRGRTLEQELKERGRWGGKEAASAAVDLCRALAAIHAAGFVHGDIKAQNVVRQEGGQFVLMDFGAWQPRDADLVVSGVVGTPLYVAPELLAGAAPTVETDIYSMGVLAYHLVTGTYPVTGASLAALRAQHQRRLGIVLHDVRPDLDAGFVRVIERTLAPDPRERFHSAGELAAAFAQVLGARGDPTPPVAPRKTATRWLAVTLTTAALLMVVVSQWSRPALSDSVAVLAFRMEPASDELTYFGEAISDDLTSLLSRLPDLNVTAASSVHQFRHISRSPTEIGEALGVKMLVAGSVHRAADRVSVSVELIDCATGKQVWGDRFVRPTSDLFAELTEIARHIAGALRGRLSSRSAELLERPPMQYQAFDLYALGRYHWGKRTLEGFHRAIKYFQDASAADLTSALPFAGLSDAYVLASAYGWLAPLDAQRRAEEAAGRALELDRNLAEAHAALGSVRHVQLRWRDAEAEFVRAIDLKPGYSPAHHWYGLYLACLGRFDPAVDQLQLAVTQDPLSVAVRAALGFVYFMKGDPERAVEHYARALALEDDRDWLHRHAAIANLALGLPDQALRHLDRVPAGSAMAIDLNAVRAAVYASAGRTAEARALIAPLETPPTSGPFSAIDQAWVRFTLQDVAAAYVWLDRAVARREDDVQYLAVDPRFSGQRADPRFQSLLKQIGLDQIPGGRQ